MKAGECRFCGGKSNFIAYEDLDISTACWVECLNRDCGAHGPIRFSDQDAILAWNDKTSSIVNDEEELQELRRLRNEALYG